LALIPQLVVKGHMLRIQKDAVTWDQLVATRVTVESASSDREAAMREMKRWEHFARVLYHCISQ